MSNNHGAHNHEAHNQYDKVGEINHNPHQNNQHPHPNEYQEYHQPSGFEERNKPRRQEDIQRMQIIDKLLNVIKYALVLIAVAFYFSYNTFQTKVGIAEEYMSKIDNLHQMMTNKDSDEYIRNTRAFNISRETKTCKNCHLDKTNLLILGGKWDFQKFKNYVRGINRHDNHIMPEFTEKQVSTETLEQMYFILKLQN